MAAATGDLIEQKGTTALELPQATAAGLPVQPEPSRSIVSGDMSTSVEVGRDRLVRQIHDLRASDVAVAGGKGANLGELTCAGFPCTRRLRSHHYCLRYCGGSRRRR